MLNFIAKSKGDQMRTENFNFVESKKSPLINFVKLSCVLFIFVGSFSVRARGECEPPERSKELETVNLQKVLTTEYWTAFKDTKPRQCWAVSVPVKSSVVPKVAQDDLCRTSTSLAVHFIPELSRFGEVVFKSGYVFSGMHPVQLEIDKETILKLTVIDGEYAWANDSIHDEEVRSQMFKGNEIKLQGMSKGGAVVEDIFNLEGFKPSFEAAYGACIDIYS